MDRKISHEESLSVLPGLLLRLGYTMATAESCTGGMIAASCTDIAGSSAWFSGGVIAYANSVKENVLGVPAEVLAEHGAVSGEVVMRMALGALHVCGTQAAVAVSGVAGPGGGTAEKPVGTVWTAVAARERPGKSAFDPETLASDFPDGARLETAAGNVILAAIPHRFDGGRAAIRQQAARAALAELAVLLSLIEET